MNAEFFSAIEQIEKEKGISKEYMLDKISQALITAYRRDHQCETDNVFVNVDESKHEIRMYVAKEVVETVEDMEEQISLNEARRMKSTAEIGDIVNIEVSTGNFGRIAAQTAKQVIIQGIREAERNMVYEKFTSKEHEILTGVVSKIDAKSGIVTIRLGSNTDVTEAILLPNEQVKGEKLTEGERIKVYVVEVRRATRGPQILISRSHPGLVKRLFEVEVPEIFDGTVEIKSIVREAGSRTKMAVWSNDEEVDAIGACVGPRGSRVSNVVEELGGEKIDIIRYSEDEAEYIASALAPATVVDVEMAEGSKSCCILVPDDQLSLAIGRDGQNARLAARLTGFKIDIKPESQGFAKQTAEAVSDN